MRKTVYEWLDANRKGTAPNKKRRPKKPIIPTTANDTTPPSPTHPRSTKRRKPK